MWGWRRCRARASGRGLEELRARRREREAALRKARRQEQLVSKRLLREDPVAEGGQDGAEIVLDPLTEEEVSELLRGVQRSSEDRRRSLSRLRWALQNKETQQKFVRLDGSIRVLIGLFTSSLANMQMEAARCLHELSHSSDPAVAEACLPVTSYLLTYLSGHSVEFTELCLYTLGNLVVESEAVRKQLLPQGIIPALASCIQSPHEAVLEGLGYVLSQLLQAKEAPTEIVPLVLDSGLPQHMLRLVCSGLKSGTGAAVEFAWCLHYIVSDEPFFCSAVLTLDLLPALLQLLPCSQTVSVLVLTVLCNIAEKGPAYCQELHRQAVIPPLLGTLMLTDSEVVGQCLELLHLLFLHWPEAAVDFVSQGGHRALEQHQSTPELQERVRALLDMASQPVGASAAGTTQAAALPAFS
ncbi:transmembrane and coiled-coil domain-containing protein 6 isoform X2 [Dromaius novaehollandiae]|uniref:transmembrane and coiled-coil domain-containing protein 6 isoform X2 n=1 Tax=Dromaius novaehollandiae TaxID=8790 RepID=UPI00311FC99C